MRITQSDINEICEYLPLDIREHQVTEEELQYFRREPGETDSSIPGNILVIVLSILISVFCIVWGIQNRMYALFIVLIVTGFTIALNIMAIQRSEGNSWEQYQRGFIRPAEIVVPNAYIVELPDYYNTYRRSITDPQPFCTYETISTGLYEKEKIRILLKTMDEEGHSHSTYDEVGEELEEQLNQVIGKTCLAKVHTKAKKPYLIEVYIDRVIN